MFILPMLVYADAIEIDGIYYTLNNEGNVAEVTFNPSKYSGNIVIPNEVTYEDVKYSVTSIRNQAFYGCKDIISVTIPSSVISIRDEAFSGCSGLTSVTVNANAIGYGAFSGCSSLSSVTIGNSVTSIGNEAFQECRGLNTVTIPNSVTSIGNYAFYNCSALTSVAIGNSVTSIGTGAFQSCTALTSIAVGDGNTKYDSRNNCNAIIETSTNKLIVGCKGTIIPNSVTSIGNYAFQYCSGLTSLTIPNSVSYIGNGAFEWCSGLTSMDIPNSVTFIGSGAFASCKNIIYVTISKGVTSISNSAFANCSSLTSVDIPSSVTIIESGAFQSCSALTTIVIPYSMTSIGEGAFMYCNNLTDVYCHAENVPETGSDAFYYSGIGSATLHVRESSIEAYQSAKPWKGFKSIVALANTDPGTPQCAKPTISFIGGKLHFECETEGVEFHYEFTTPASGNGTGNDVAVSSSYVVNVYASKANHADSEVATASVNVAGLKGDVNGDGNVTITDAVSVVNIILSGGASEEGTQVSHQRPNASRIAVE